VRAERAYLSACFPSGPSGHLLPKEEGLHPRLAGASLRGIAIARSVAGPHKDGNLRYSNSCVW
jgi:hypothetical protein